MKQYNKQQVMKDAHRLYGSEYHRRGHHSWCECLRTAWDWEKDAVRARKEKATRLDAMIAASWAARKNDKSTRNEFEGMSPDAVSFSMGYGRGLCCGD